MDARESERPPERKMEMRMKKRAILRRVRKYGLWALLVARFVQVIVWLADAAINYCAVARSHA